jgi:predicted AlkP superfamily pyrophosphatase or phosphodiesterase
VAASRARALALLLLLSLAASLLGCGAPGRQPRVLLVGVEGLGVEALGAAHAPTLERMRRGGASTLRARTTAPPEQAAAWASLLTGVWPAKHGVSAEHPGDDRLDRFPTIFARLREARPGLASLSVVRRAELIDDLRPRADEAVLVETDREVTRALLARLGRRAPELVFLHYGGVEEAARSVDRAPGAPELSTAIAAFDGDLGAIVRELALRTAEDWLVIVTSDRSGLPGDGRVPAIVWGRGATQGELGGVGLVDLNATALFHLGARVPPQWGLDGRPVGVR